MTLVLTSVGSFTRNLRVALFIALIECTCKHAANTFYPTMDSQKYLNRNPNGNWQGKTSSLFTNITSTRIQHYWRIFLKYVYIKKNCFVIFWWCFIVFIFCGGGIIFFKDMNVYPYMIWIRFTILLHFPLCLQLLFLYHHETTLI